MENTDITKRVLADIIIGYRQLIQERYQYEDLQEKYDIPSAFTPKRIEQIKDYFLNEVYPPPQKRVELDKAFDSLSDYLKHPEKLLRLVIDSTSLLFKHGRHLPKIFRAAMGALQSFQTGTSFESQLVKEAIDSQLEPPYSKVEMYQLLRTLSPTEIKELIKSGQFLFEILQDRPLVKKIIDIIDHLIARMKKRPNIYTEQDIKGLVIGREIIQKGDTLYGELPKEAKAVLFDLIVQVEEDELRRILGSKYV